MQGDSRRQHGGRREGRSRESHKGVAQGTALHYQTCSTPWHIAYLLSWLSWQHPAAPMSLSKQQLASAITTRPRALLRASEEQLATQDGSKPRTDQHCGSRQLSELRPAAGGAGRLSQNDQRSGLRCFLEEIQMVGIQILGPGEWMSEEKTKMVSCLVANGADICNAPASICHFPWSSSGPL